MASYAKIQLTGGTNGRGIKVAATATRGTTIHTATAVASVLDEIHLWAFNSDSAERLLTIEFGGVTDPDDLIEILIPSQQGLIQVVPGLVLDGGLVVTAFAAAANVITLNGFVNRITGS